MSDASYSARRAIDLSLSSEQGGGERISRRESETAVAVAEPPVDEMEDYDIPFYPIGVYVFLTNDAPEEVRPVIEAINEMMATSGLEIHDSEEGRGSFWQSWFGRIASAAIQKHRDIVKLAAGVVSGTVVPNSGADVVTKLLSATERQDGAIIIYGSLLFVKAVKGGKSVVVALQLNGDELARVKSRSSALIDPLAMLQFIGEIEEERQRNINVEEALTKIEV